MYIEPNSTVKLLSGVPLDNSYRHTVVWDSATAQYNGFNAYTKYTLNNQSYQRVNQGIFRCDLPSDNCYDCNYMMFQNTAYSNKWFYAFITGVEYINNNMCKITFEIDIIQTWYNEWSFKSCFVERETTATDGMFEHLVAEDFNSSDYVARFEHLTTGMCKTASGYSGTSYVGIVITSEIKKDGEWVRRGAVDIGNIINCLFFHAFTVDNAGLNLLTNFILEYETAGKGDAILSAYTVPRYVLDDFVWENGGLIYNNNAMAVTTLHPIVRNVYPTDLDGYIPKNKKLFSSPYCMVELNNHNGSSQLYKPQDLSYSDDKSLRFRCEASYMPNGEIWCRPNMNTVDSFTNNAVVSLASYPQGVVTYDYFNNWWVSEKINYTAKSVNSVINTAQRAFTAPVNSYPLAGDGYQTIAQGNITGLAKGLANSFIGGIADAEKLFVNEMATVKQADIIPPNVIGNSSGFNMLVATSAFDFCCTLRTLRRDVAEQIDNYFSVYGYKVNTLKIPTLRNRPHWTYIKTVQCTIEGNMPSDDISKIERIVDNGITFWRNISEVGDYSLDNTI